jgi:hypothetical protein
MRMVEEYRSVANVECMGEIIFDEPGNKMGCRSILEIEPKDLEKKRKKDYDGGFDVTYTYVCLKCGAKTEINKQPNWSKEKVI